MRVGAHVVVMASSSLTAVQDVTTPAVLTSLTLAAVRRLSAPVLVVTANTRCAPTGATPGTGTRPTAQLSPGGAAVKAAAALDGGSTFQAADASSPRAERNSKTTRTPAQLAVSGAVGAGGMRMLVLLDRGSMPLLQWVADSLWAQRGDSLVLAQQVPHAAFNTAQQRQNYQAALDGAARQLGSIGACSGCWVGHH